MVTKVLGDDLAGVLGDIDPQAAVNAGAQLATSIVDMARPKDAAKLAAEKAAADKAAADRLALSQPQSGFLDKVTASMKENPIPWCIGGAVVVGGIALILRRR